MKKPVFILLVVAILAINLLPTGIVPYNSQYYNDLVYLGLYDGGNFVVGQTQNSFSTPLNTNHFFVNLLRIFPGDAIPSYILTVLYLIILGFSLWGLIKALGDYKKIGILAILLVLCTKKYLAYLLTVLPFGGIFTFLISSIAILLTMAIEKKVTLPKLLFLTLCITAFSLYDNATAACGLVLGIITIFLVKICNKKSNKVLSVLAGGFIIIISAIFAFCYKGVGYENILKSGYENGIALYGGITPSSYLDIMLFYFKHPGFAIKHIQSLLNNGFYYGPDMPFALVDKIKGIIVPCNIWIFSGLLVAIIAYMVTIYKKHPVISVFVMGVVVMLCESLKIYGLFYGLSNLVVNLMLYNLFFDILVTVGIVGICYITTQNKKEFKEKYGATQ